MNMALGDRQSGFLSPVTCPMAPAGPWEMAFLRAFFVCVGTFFFARSAQQKCRAMWRKTGVLRQQNPGFCAARAAIERLLKRLPRFGRPNPVISNGARSTYFSFWDLFFSWGREQFVKFPLWGSEWRVLGGRRWRRRDVMMAPRPPPPVSALTSKKHTPRL